MTWQEPRLFGRGHGEGIPNKTIRAAISALRPVVQRTYPYMLWTLPRSAGTAGCEAYANTHEQCQHDTQLAPSILICTSNVKTATTLQMKPAKPLVRCQCDGDCQEQYITRDVSEGASRADQLPPQAMQSAPVYCVCVWTKGMVQFVLHPSTTPACDPVYQ